MPEAHGPVDPVPDFHPVPDPATDPAPPAAADDGVRAPSDPLDDKDPLFQQMLDDRARNEAALADAELELLAQADQLREELAMDEAGRELLAARAADAAAGQPSDWAADLDHAADLVNAFLDAHGTAMVLDLMAGLLADPKWSRAWREFVAAQDRAA